VVKRFFSRKILVTQVRIFRLDSCLRRNDKRKG
jgi:hypothetical protein